MDNDKSIKTLTRSKLRPFRYHPYKVKEDLKANFIEIYKYNRHFINKCWFYNRNDYSAKVLLILTKLTISSNITNERK